MTGTVLNRSGGITRGEVIEVDEWAAQHLIERGLAQANWRDPEGPGLSGIASSYRASAVRCPTVSHAARDNHHCAPYATAVVREPSIMPGGTYVNDS